MCWRLILEEFGSDLKYIKGKDNFISDVLSYLKTSDNQDVLNISELYGYDDEDLPDSAYPIRYHNIAKAQKTLVSYAKIEKYAYLQEYIRKLYIGITICSIIRDRLKQSIPSVNILNGKAFTQQSTTCVRHSQHAKKQKQLFRNMANCHLNRLK